MDKAEYSNLMAAAEAAKHAAIAQANTEYNKSVEAIKRVWELSGGSKPPEAIIPVNVAPPQVKPAKKKPRKMIRWAIGSLEEFNTPRIAEAIRHHFNQEVPTGQISGYLNKLYNNNDIERIKIGGGRSPHKYRKINSKASVGTNGKESG